MSYLMISSILQGQNLIGYRLIDTETHEICNVPLANLIDVIKQKKATVDNIRVTGNKVSGTNGAIDRYPKSTLDGTLIKKKISSLIIINRTSNGFTVCDHKGQVRKIDENTAVEYVKQAGIANGKLVFSDDKVFISAINGNYPLAPDSVKPADTVKPVETRQAETVKPVETRQAETVKPVETKQTETVKPITRKPVTNTPSTSSTPSTTSTSSTNPTPSPQKQAENKLDRIKSVLNETQQSLVDKYYRFYLSLKNNKETARLEISEIVNIVESGTLKDNYKANELFFNLLGRMEDLSSLEKFTCKEYHESLEGFVMEELPIPKSMRQLFYEYLSNHRDIGFKHLFPKCYKSIREAIAFSENWIDNNINTILSCILADDFCENDLCELGKYCWLHNMVKLGQSKLLNALEINGLDIKDSEIIHEGFCDSEDFVIWLLLYYPNTSDSFLDTHYKSELYADYLNSEINKGLVNLINKYVEYRLKKSKSVPSFSSILKQHEIDKENESLTDQKSTINPVDTGVKPEEMTPFEWFDTLLKANTYNEEDINIKIAKDIHSRDISYDSLSSKQKYRVDNAIKILEDANFKRLGITPKSDKSDKQNKQISTTSSDKSDKSDKIEYSTDLNEKIPDEENKTYMLDEYTEINDMVNRILSYADKPELVPALEQSPNLLKICFSVHKYNKATSRQLRHLRLACEILDKQ